MLYHFLEARLEKVCALIGDELKSDIHVKHLTGSGIERSLLFLRLVAMLDFSNVKGLSYIRSCRRLRNVVVHAGGHIQLSNSRVAQFVQSEPTLDGQSHGEIAVTKEFVLKFVDSVKALIVEIHDAMQALMRKAGNTGDVYLVDELGRVPIYGRDPLGKRRAS